jgi:thymidylate synthase (FAD)
MQTIERAYRTCYRLEGKMTDTSYITYLPRHRNHQASAEHMLITVRYVISRAIQQELTRHRIASYSFESTRWVDYYHKNEITFVTPITWNQMTDEQRNVYENSCNFSETSYRTLRSLDVSGQHARDVLPLALASEGIVSMNPRSWRNFFELRCDATAHPDIQWLAKNTLIKFCQWGEPLFGDLQEKFLKEPTE